MFVFPPLGGNPVALTACTDTFDNLNSIIINKLPYCAYDPWASFVVVSSSSLKGQRCVRAAKAAQRAGE